MGWKLFAVVNYLFLLFYGFVLFKMMQYLVEDPPPQPELLEIISVIVSLILIVSNSAINILVFHLNLPQRPLGRARGIAYTVMGVLHAISIGWILYLARTIWDTELNREEDSWIVFFRVVFVFTFVLGTFVVIQQLRLRKILKEQQALNLSKMIEEIGKDKE